MNEQVALTINFRVYCKKHTLVGAGVGLSVGAGVGFYINTTKEAQVRLWKFT